MSEEQVKPDQPGMSDDQKSSLGLVWEFLRVRKKWWLTPIIVFVMLLSFLIVATQGSAVAPFIYAIF
jgi:hypothetical protein